MKNTNSRRQFLRTGPTLLVPLLLVAILAAARASDEPPIDVARGKQLMRKFQAGETLTSEEQDYLDRVRQEIRKRATGQRSGSAPNAPARPVVVNKSDWKALVPITDMTAPYKGEDGGLYGDGRNEPPDAHRAAYLNESEKIRPLDQNGEPSDEGKIGLISIGFSNTSIEWENFKRTADADSQKSPSVVLVNGSIGGRSAVMWAWDGAEVLPKAEQDRLDKEMDVVRMPKTGRRSSVGVDKDTWPTLATRIEAAGLSTQQVQAVWLKHVEANPKPLGEFPAHLKPTSLLSLTSPVSITPVCESLTFPAGPSVAGRGARAAVPSPTPTNPALARAGSCRARSKATRD